MQKLKTAFQKNVISDTFFGVTFFEIDLKNVNLKCIITVNSVPGGTSTSTKVGSLARSGIMSLTMAYAYFLSTLFSLLLIYTIFKTMLPWQNVVC